MICKRCNHINDDGAKFCIKCGAPMDENYSQSQSINYNQPNYNDYTILQKRLTRLVSWSVFFCE